MCFSPVGNYSKNVLVRRFAGAFSGAVKGFCEWLCTVPQLVHSVRRR